MDSDSERPRRSRPPRDLPIIPIVIGVLLGGLAIGVGFAGLRGGRGDVVQVASATAAPSPHAVRTSSPAAPVRVAEATPSARPSIRPATAAASQPSPVAASPRSDAPLARAAASPTNAPITPGTPKATVKTIAIKPVELSPPAAARAATARAPTAPTRAPATAIPVSPAVADETDSEFAAQAARLVRQYVAALVRGDEPAAYAALGGTAGTQGLRLIEEEFIDRTARITSLRSHGTDESATVETDVNTSRGAYFMRFKVARTAAGPVIRDHDYIKP